MSIKNPITGLVGQLIKANMPGIMAELKAQLPSLIEEHKDKIPEYLDKFKGFLVGQLGAYDGDNSGVPDAQEYHEDFSEAAGHLAALFAISQRVAGRADKTRKKLFPEAANEQSAK